VLALKTQQSTFWSWGASEDDAPRCDRSLDVTCLKNSRNDREDHRFSFPSDGRNQLIAKGKIK